MAGMDYVAEALREAAEALTGRPVTSQGKDLLKRLYGQQSGTARQKARGALKGFAAISEAELEHRCNASDDTDRKVKDAEGKADQWDP